MRCLHLRLRVLAFLLSICAIPGLAAENGVQAVDSAWSTAMKANDLEAVMRTYAADAVVWLPGAAEARGEQAIRASYGEMLAANIVTDVALSDTHYRTVGNDAVGWGKFTLTLTPKAGGAPVVLRGRFTAIAEHRNGRWVYTVDHASADPAEPEKAVEPAEATSAGG